MVIRAALHPVVAHSTVGSTIAGALVFGLLLLGCVVGMFYAVTALSHRRLNADFAQVAAMHPQQRSWLVVAVGPSRSRVLIDDGEQIQLAKLDGDTEFKVRKDAITSAVVRGIPAGALGLARPGLRLSFANGAPATSLDLIFPRLGSLWSSRLAAEEVRRIVSA